ncbi:MAG: ABC transporter permease [Coriobacteriia bacterium]|nr:ABC transporter permease [Coriobacteriia bacterium]
MTRTARILLPLAATALLVTAWHVAATRVGSTLLFPPPGSVVLGAVETAAGGRLFGHIVASLQRFAIGYLGGIAIGVPLGLLLGLSVHARSAFDPIIQVLRPISPIAWFPLFTLWFGIGELPAIAIVFTAAVYPVILTTTSAVREVDPLYLKVARTFGDSRAGTVARIILPASLPGIAVGLRIAVGTSWVFIVAGEMLGVTNGLGYLIIDARNSLRTDLVLVAIVIIGALGLGIDRALRLAEARVRRHWGGAA